MKKEIILISDLDKTLIYSDRDREFCKNKNNICVEYKNGQPLSYMTKKAYNTFNTLIKDKVIFIPCTMRSVEQLNRIDLIREVNPKYMVCYNGCELYVDGELNKDYQNYIKNYFDKNEMKDLYNKYTNKYNELRVISFNDYYFEIKTRNKIEKEIILEELNKELNLEAYKLFSVSLKIYVMPKNIDKIHALKFLESNLLKGTYFAMGDSLVDEKFINHAYYSFVPNHVEFKPKLLNTYRSNKPSILSGEDILSKLDEIIN